MSQNKNPKLSQSNNCGISYLILLYIKAWFFELATFTKDLKIPKALFITHEAFLSLIIHQMHVERFRHKFYKYE